MAVQNNNLSCSKTGKSDMQKNCSYFDSDICEHLFCIEILGL